MRSPPPRDSGRKISPRKINTPTTRSHTAIKHGEPNLHPNTLTSNLYTRQAFLSWNVPLSPDSRVAWNQRYALQSWDEQERYPQAAALFHDFAKARILQKADFVRKGSSWTFTPKGDTGNVPYEEATVKPRKSVALAKESKPLAAQSPDQESSKRSRDKISGVPDGIFLLQILEPCSDGAPFMHRIGWNCNVCRTELTSTLRTPGRRCQLQQDARQQTTSRDCTLRSVPSHATWAQLQRRNRNGLPTRE